MKLFITFTLLSLLYSCGDNVIDVSSGVPIQVLELKPDDTVIEAINIEKKRASFPLILQSDGIRLKREQRNYLLRQLKSKYNYLTLPFRFPFIFPILHQHSPSLYYQSQVNSILNNETLSLLLSENSENIKLYQSYSAEEEVDYQATFQKELGVLEANQKSEIKHVNLDKIINGQEILFASLERNFPKRIESSSYLLIISRRKETQYYYIPQKISLKNSLLKYAPEVLERLGDASSEWHYIGQDKLNLESSPKAKSTIAFIKASQKEKQKSLNVPKKIKSFELKKSDLYVHDIKDFQKALESAAGINIEFDQPVDSVQLIGKLSCGNWTFNHCEPNKDYTLWNYFEGHFRFFDLIGFKTDEVNIPLTVRGRVLEKITDTLQQEVLELNPSISRVKVHAKIWPYLDLEKYSLHFYKLLPLKQ